ncbi:hypothetical protein As57867_011650, partial [Aphanomyces stellatus]
MHGRGRGGLLDEIKKRRPHAETTPSTYPENPLMAAIRGAGPQTSRRKMPPSTKTTPFAQGEVELEGASCEVTEDLLEERLLLAPDRAQVLASLSPTSPEFHYFDAIRLLHELEMLHEQPSLRDETIDAILAHARALAESSWCSRRADRIQHRLHLVLLQQGHPRGREYFIDALALDLNSVGPRPGLNAEVVSLASHDCSSFVSFNVETIMENNMAKLKASCLEGKVDVSTAGRALLGDMSAYMRQQVFQQVMSSTKLPDWAEWQKQCVVHYLLNERLLEWTDFDEFMDAMAKGILDPKPLKSSSEWSDDCFGSNPYHKKLTLSQMDVLWDACSSVLQHSVEFALQYVLRLRASVENDARTFLPLALLSLKRFGPPMNGLRFVLLHQWLRLMQFHPTYPALGSSFLDYIALPRDGSLVAHDALVLEADADAIVIFESKPAAGLDHQRFVKCTISELSTALGYSAIDADVDKTLIQDIFASLVQRGSTTDDFAPYLSPKFLASQYAIAMLSSGRGTRAEFEGALTDPRDRDRLFHSSDVSFCTSNPSTFGPDDPVSLLLTVKNIKAVTIQLFDLNVGDHYRRTFRPISRLISLDGLLPNEEQHVRFDNVPSHVRTQHRIEFASLCGIRRGRFIVEVIGDNCACRALIRKGCFGFTQTVTARGHEFKVLDEANHVVLGCVAVVPDVKVTTKQRTFAAAPDGTILVPFSTTADETKSTKTPIYLGEEAFGILEAFQHCNEHYKLKTNMFVDKGQLRPGDKATAIIRTTLSLQGQRVSSAFLTNVSLSVVVTSVTHVETKHTIRNLSAPNDTDDLVATVDVPLEAASIQLTLHAQVVNPHSDRSTTVRRQVRDVSDSRRFEIARPTDGNVLFHPHLKRVVSDRDAFVVLMLGHNGEPVPRIHAKVQLQHFAFRTPLTFGVISDDDGVIHLGVLAHIQSINVDIRGKQTTWTLPLWKSHSWVTNALANAHVIHCTLESSVHLPVPSGIARDDLVRWLAGDAIAVYNRIEADPRTTILERCDQGIGVGDTTRARGLVFNPSCVGTFDIVVKPTRLTYRVKVTADKVVTRYSMTSPVRLDDVCIHERNLTLHAMHTTPSTRAHVVLTRFVGSSAAASTVLTQGIDGDAGFASEKAATLPKNDYFDSKRIGDEYAYVLGRRAFEQQHPSSKRMLGNRLPPPSVLLNPYTTQATEGLALEETKEGDAYKTSHRGDHPGVAPRKSLRNRCSAEMVAKSVPDDCATPHTLFLATPSLVVANVHFDTRGDATISLPEDLVGVYDIVVSVLDGTVSTTRQCCAIVGQTTPTPSWVVPLRDTRLSHIAALPTTGHAVQIRGHRCLVTLGEEAAIDLPCSGSAKVEVYDSFEHAFDLLDTLTRHNVLHNDYLKCWHTLSRTTKEAIYSHDVSHELNVFLYKKDRAFFDAVVAPHLRVKFAKDFIDLYLLDDTVALQSYVTSAKKFDNLSVVEMLLLAERVPRAAATPICQYLVRLIETYGDEATSTKLDAVFEHVLTAKRMTVPDDAGAAAFGDQADLLRRLGKLERQLQQCGLAIDDDNQDDEDDEWQIVPEPDHDDEGNSIEAKQKEGRRRVYLAPGTTKKREERRYHNGQDQTQALRGGLVCPATAIASGRWVGSAINRFWLDYARHLLRQQDGHPPAPFLSAHFPEATSKFAEIMAALSVLDLPFAGNTWTMSTPSTASNMVIQSTQPAIVYFEAIEMEETSPLPDALAVVASKLVVMQTLFDPQDSTTGGFLPPVKEFVRQKRYGCHVEVTNLSHVATPTLNLLVQIPQGAIPVTQNGYETRNLAFSLGGNTNKTVEFYFYFPSEGTFSHFPAHVAIDGQTVRWSDESPMSPRSIAVVAASTVVDITSWKDVAARGSAETVLAFLQSYSQLERIEWGLVTWRLQDKAFYEVLVRFMRLNFVYKDEVWQYAFHHDDKLGMAELLQRRLSPYEVGPGLKSPFFLPIELYDSVGDCVQACLEHAEFTPFILRRTHSMKGNEVIPNKDLRDYYCILCHSLCLLPSLQDHHYLVLVYFMVVLNRLDTALDLFSNIHDPAAFQMQYDYMNGFLDFYRDDAGFPIARAVAQSYKSYPEQRWRMLFGCLQEQLDELDTMVPTGEGAAASSSVQDVSLEMTVGKGSFVLSQRGHRITRCVAKYYPVDVEVMFSREPFSGQDAKVSSCISLIKPRATHAIQLSTTDATTAVEMPTALQSTQMLVVVSPEDFPELEVVKPHFCDTMDVSFGLDEGLVQVFASHRPLARTYVKVFVQTKASKKPTFYKDGYTDICGRFDYMAINDTALLL